MKPTYYVRAAPHHADLPYTFNAFSIQPARGELFDIAHVILVAEALPDLDTTIGQPGNHSNQAWISHQAVALFYQIMQQETTLPVVRRMVEALRQTNTVLYREKQSVRIMVGLLIKDTLYLVCVGNVSAHLIRNGKVAPLLCAERTRDRYLGHSAQLLLDYQIQLLPFALIEQPADHAYLPTDHFVLEPSDTLILASTELTPEQIKPTVLHARQPERLAADLAQATALHQAGQASGVVALHWRVDRVSQAVKQVGLVLLIFLCVTLAMQWVVQVNQRIDRYLAVYAETARVQSPSSSASEAALAVPTTPNISIDHPTRVQDRTWVTVHVNVNMELIDTEVPITVENPTLVHPTLVPAPIAALVATTTPVQLLPTRPLPVVPLATPTRVLSPVLIATDLPTASPTVLSTVLPTVLSTDLPAVLPTVLPIESPIVGSTTGENSTDAAAVNTPLAPALRGITTVALLAPPEQASSEDSMTFAWQSDLVLPPDQAYEVIVWQNGQSPLSQGLGIASPIQEDHVMVHFKGLHTAGVVQPGVYQWGVLLVTVEPYTRLALLDGGRTLTFTSDRQSAPSCDPDRATC